ncbi:MAG: hypothetical protein R3F07_06930 [Opitutaceae bacterium]
MIRYERLSHGFDLIFFVRKTTGEIRRALVIENVRPPSVPVSSRID